MNEKRKVYLTRSIEGVGKEGDVGIMKNIDDAEYRSWYFEFPEGLIIFSVVATWLELGYAREIKACHECGREHVPECESKPVEDKSAQEKYPGSYATTWIKRSIEELRSIHIDNGRNFSEDVAVIRKVISNLESLIK